MLCWPTQSTIDKLFLSLSEISEAALTEKTITVNDMCVHTVGYDICVYLYLNIS